MTNSEARDIIFATAECEARQDKCDKNNCDECQLFYMQGTVKEHREALSMAIQALENQYNESVKGDLISRSVLLQDLKIEDGGTPLIAYQTDFLYRAISDQPTACNDGWIPCSERLPDKYEEVLVYCKGRFTEGTHVGEECKTYGIGYCYHGRTWRVYQSKSIKDIEVIAWMPLPSAYGKEDENG